MKQFFITHKKMSLVLLAGILTTAIALGGIFAWFTSTAPVVGGDYEAAKVELGMDEGTAILWNWLPGSAAARDTHQWLMTNIADKSIEEQSTVLGGFWLDITGADSDSDLDKLFDLLNLPYMTAGVLGDDSPPFIVSPGSLVDYSGTANNESNIPVYLRMKNPKPYIIAKDGAWEYVPAMIFAENYETHERTLLIADENNEWLYFTKPLGIVDDVKDDEGWVTESGDRQMAITMVTYAPYSLDSKYSDGTIKFDEVQAEIIQATNDAAYFAWSKTIPFEPYVAPVTP